MDPSKFHQDQSTLGRQSKRVLDADQASALPQANPEDPQTIRLDLADPRLGGPAWAAVVQGRGLGALAWVKELVQFRLSALDDAANE